MIVGQGASGGSSFITSATKECKRASPYPTLALAFCLFVCQASAVDPRVAVRLRLWTNGLRSKEKDENGV